VKDRPPLDKHDALADQQGRFRFEGLSAEAWELTGPPGASVVATVKAGETTAVTLVARSKPRVRGRVTDASGPVAGVEVSADMQFALLGGWLTGFDKVTTDANGQFDLEQEAPGHYRVGGRQAGTSTRSVDIDLEWDAAPWVELRFPGGIVRGRVVEADGGAPVAGATVALASAAKAALPLKLVGGKKRTTTTDAEGRFELQRVPGMEWAVYVVEDRHVEPPSVRVDVPEDAAARELVVALQRAGSVRGRVSALNGAPLPKGLLVRAVGLDAQPDVGAITPEQDGSFECRQLAPGRWRCELATSSEAPALQTREATVIAGEVAEVEFAVTF